MKQLTIFQRRKKSILDSVYIAEPCNVGFENMEGDDRVRFCNQCKLNVYNISQMTKREAEKLIQESDGRTCLRLYRRADGTIITDNCPIGLRAARERLRKVIILFATFVGWRFLIHAVSAQGLVGGPIDGPMFGRSSEPNYNYIPDESYDISKDVVNVIAPLSGILTLIISSIFLRKKFSTLKRLSIEILVTFVVLFFIYVVGQFCINNFGGLGGGL
ncbi:MAG: hypothetical protein K2W82_12650 [Candidatus Obscuribacterales bacterium]|nr:hypothetical protein [Candidatus Obscuribacterales bacterium]